MPPIFDPFNYFEKTLSCLSSASSAVRAILDVSFAVRAIE
jgi:hypothetical protein